MKARSIWYFVYVGKQAYSGKTLFRVYNNKEKQGFECVHNTQCQTLMIKIYSTLLIWSRVWHRFPLSLQDPSCFRRTQGGKWTSSVRIISLCTSDNRNKNWNVSFYRNIESFERKWSFDKFCLLSRKIDGGKQRRSYKS